jgi:hypothetical protein
MKRADSDRRPHRILFYVRHRSRAIDELLSGKPEFRCVR